MYSAHRSLGLVTEVPTPHGTFASSNAPPYCGSPYAMQQMLADLGFYGGAIDGQVGTGTLNAASEFARSRGVSNLQYVTPEFCRLLTGQWEAKTAAVSSGSARPLPGQFTVPLRRATLVGQQTTSAWQDSQDEQPPPLVPPDQSGWASLAPTTQYAIIGASALMAAGGLIVFVVGRKRKKKK